MDKKSDSHHILMGDFNAKTEIINMNDDVECMRPWNRQQKRKSIKINGFCRRTEYDSN